MRRAPGFSLIELMITLTILAVVVAALMVVMTSSQRSKAATEALVEAQQQGRVVLDIIARDVRSAGYGVDEDAAPPQPAFAYVDSVELILYANLRPSVLGSSSAPSATQPPLAPDPTGAPLPAKITGTYLPPMKYRTGAEMVRYTLDLNNDGAVDASDQAHAAASDARRSPNPNDFVFARIVYGDSSGTTPTAGFNGGAVEKVGLVRGPAADVPPLFTVYLGSNPLPWNWANGPVPANRLDEISRVVINVTTESRRPDRSGTFLRSVQTTEVNSVRNQPDAGFTSYTVDGYVFDDVNGNGVRNGGEPGLANVFVRLGATAVDQTNALGYYFMQAPPGSYVLRQEVPEGYGPFTPDSVVVDLIASPADFSHDFADTAKRGGWIHVTAWLDTDKDTIRDAGEPPQDGVEVTVAATTKLTDGTGYAKFFAAPGDHSVTAAAPESLVISTTNPVSVTVNDGDSVAVQFGVQPSGSGKVTGRVYKDLNRNALYDAGEPGLGNVWVGVTKNGGAELMGFSYTKSDGTYEVSVPNNLPEGTAPYHATLEVPPGYHPTSPSSVGPIWVADGGTAPNNDFGLQNFQIITLNAERVLSLGTGELMEKDWIGNDNQYEQKGHKDVDLILGSEWTANPNISVWFNDWNNTPLFASTPTYQRNAWSSALSIAVAPLDNQDPPERPDVVTGLESYASGNFAVWLTQNTSGNFGFLPSTPVYYQTLGGGDANAVAATRLDGNPSFDLVVGTKTGTDAGSVEVWLNDGAGAFARSAVFPPHGGSPSLGEVRAVGFGDFDADGDADLVVGTKDADNKGLIHFFEYESTWPYFVYTRAEDARGECNALAVTDVDRDGLLDVVLGVKTADNAGKIVYYRQNAGDFSFTRQQEVGAPGVVLSLLAADMGGDATQKDLALGFRTNMTSFAGGVRLYFLDGGSIPSFGTDPSSGAANSMIPTLAANHFNAGDNPAAIPPRLTDLAAAMKTSSTTGAVLVFIR